MESQMRDRTEAGQALAKQLQVYACSPGAEVDAIVLALPRGGVPVGFEVAMALHLPLDVCLVRKLGVPGHPELAMGAIASGGVRVLNMDIVQRYHLSNAMIHQVAAQELQELQRRDRLYRGDRPRPKIQGRTVILVDDGLATGATMRAAIAVLKPEQPQAIIVAVPVAPADSCRLLAEEVDQLICLLTPSPFYSLGQWYTFFDQTSDEEVRALLSEAEAAFWAYHGLPTKVNPAQW
jgi:putative phosphoribosyl transferase